MQHPNTPFSRPLPLFLTFIPPVVDSMSDEELQTLLADVDCGRLNLSHVTSEGRKQEGREMVSRLYRCCPHLKIAMDLQGYGIRLNYGTGESFEVKTGDRWLFCYDETGKKVNTKERIYSRQSFVHDYFRENGMTNVTKDDRLVIDDLIVLNRIIDYDVEKNEILLEVVEDSVIESGKSVATTLELQMPDFSHNRKDNEDIAWTMEMFDEIGIPDDQRIYCYSFAQRAQDVLDLREAIGNDAIHVWAKIEDRCGLASASELAEVSNALVIARGDGMATIDKNAARGISKLSNGIWDVCQETGRLPVVATGNWESSGRLGHPNPVELEYSGILKRRNPGTVLWCSNVCMKKEYLIPAIKTHLLVRES